MIFLKKFRSLNTKLLESNKIFYEAFPKGNSLQSKRGKN